MTRRPDEQRLTVGHTLLQQLTFWWQIRSMIGGQGTPPMSLEQLMILAGQLAQSPHRPVTVPRRADTVSASAQLSPDELTALRQIWETPIRLHMAEPASPVRH
jgi:hypothetical protein